MPSLNRSDEVPIKKPPRLFKYLHPDRVDVLETFRICFSSPTNLNDPFELKPPLSLYESDESMWASVEKIMPQVIEETLAELPPGTRHLVNKAQLEAMVRALVSSKDVGFVSTITKLMPELHTHFNSVMEKRIGLLCLTEAPDDILMWAHYACSHEGFVIELDPETPFFQQQRSEKDELRHLRPVQYSNIRPSLIFDNASMQALLTKSEHWAYEREWRMMVDLNDATSVITVGGKSFHLFAFAPCCIKSVILGTRMAQAQRDKVLSLINGNPALGHVTCYQAAADDKFFRLNINSVEERL